MTNTSKRNLKLAANVALTLLSAFIIIYFGLKAIFYFMPFVIGYIIALIGRPIVRNLEKSLKVKRNFASIAIMVIVIAVISACMYFAGKMISAYLHDALKTLPKYYKRFMKDYAVASNNIDTVFGISKSSIAKAIDSFVKNLGNNIQGFVSKNSATAFTFVKNFASKIPYYIISLIVVFMSAYYFMLDSKPLKERLQNVLPDTITSKIDIVGEEIRHGIGGYFKAQFKIMIVIYIVLLIGLLIIKATYAPIIALFIAILDMLPVFGTGFVLLPWAVFKLFTGNYFMMGGLIILYVVCLILHQALQPKMIGDSVEMPPMLTLFCIFLGFKINGVSGMIVGVIVGLIIFRLYIDGSFNNFIENYKELWDNLSKTMRVTRKKQQSNKTKQQSNKTKQQSKKVEKRSKTKKESR